MSRRTLVLRTQADRDRASRWVQGVSPGTTVEFRQARRSLDQNALLWSRLSELSEAVEWHGQRLSPEDWKSLCTASLRKCRFVPGIDPGTVVPIGMRTSDMTKEEMNDLLTLIEAFAAERGLTFKDQEHAA